MRREDNKELLIRLAQFHCVDTTKGIKEELESFFIKQALYIKDSERKGLDFTELKTALSEHCPLANLTDNRIETILKEQTHQKGIVIIEKDRYALSENEILFLAQ